MTSQDLHADLSHMAHDADLCAKIMKKRQEEMARRTKLLDPRTRQFGISHKILDEQMVEKRRMQDSRASEDMRFVETNMLQEQVLQACEDMKSTQIKERDRAAIDYSLTHLRKEQRREFALSDPNALKNERLADPYDPTLGPCSMQKWDGDVEDMSKKKFEERSRMKGWLDEQKRERAEREQAERDIDRRFDQEMMMANEVRAVCEMAANEEARQDKVEEAFDNQRLAQEAIERKHAFQMRDIERKNNHIDAQMNSERMTERVDYVIGSHGKLLKTEYKRLSVEEEQEVHNTNARQIAQKQEMLRREAEEEAAHTSAVHLGVAVMGGIEHEKNRQAMERRQKMVEHNKKMAEDKRRTDLENKRINMSFDMPPPGY